MICKFFSLGPIETHSILIGCEETHKAAIIDPAEGAASLFLQIVKELHLDVEKILLTHSHWDHIVDVAACKRAFHCPVFVHKEDSVNLAQPGADRLPLLFPIEGVQAEGFLEEGDRLFIGKVSCIVLHTPGHSPGSLSFYFPEENFLISGDTLFKGTMGNVSFPTSSREKMRLSLQKLAKLPSETRVLPGHGQMTSIGEESWLKKI